MKTDSAPGRLGWRAWRIEDLHQLLKDLNDSGFVHVQARGELFLEHSEFLRKLTRAEQCFAHLDECAHLNGAWAAKNICSLKCAVLSKGIRKRPTPAAAAF